MPISLEQAYAPIDIAGPYGKVAETMVGAGAVINKATQDYAAWEKAKNKEELLLKAKNEIIQKKPHLAPVVKQETTAEEFGKGLAHLGVGMSLFAQAEKLNVALPDKDQFETAIFGASEDGAKAMFADLEKRIAAAETLQGKAGEKRLEEQAKTAEQQRKGTASQAALKVYGEIQAEHPDWKLEEIKAEAARRGVQASDLGSEGVEQAKVAPSLEAEARAKAAGTGAGFQGEKLKQEAEKIADAKEDDVRNLIKEKNDLQQSKLALKSKLGKAKSPMSMETWTWAELKGDDDAINKSITDIDKKIHTLAADLDQYRMQQGIYRGASLLSAINKLGAGAAAPLDMSKYVIGKP